jgi:hypothetical protein
MIRYNGKNTTENRPSIRLKGGMMKFHGMLDCRKDKEDQDRRGNKV